MSVSGEASTAAEMLAALVGRLQIESAQPQLAVAREAAREAGAVRNRTVGGH